MKFSRPPLCSSSSYEDSEVVSWKESIVKIYGSQERFNEIFRQKCLEAVHRRVLKFTGRTTNTDIWLSNDNRPDTEVRAIGTRSGGKEIILAWPTHP